MDNKKKNTACKKIMWKLQSRAKKAGECILTPVSQMMWKAPAKINYIAVKKAKNMKHKAKHHQKK